MFENNQEQLLVTAFQALTATSILTGKTLVPGGDAAPCYSRGGNPTPEIRWQEQPTRG